MVVGRCVGRRLPRALKQCNPRNLKGDSPKLYRACMINNAGGCHGA